MAAVLEPHKRGALAVAAALATLWMATMRLATYFILLPLPKVPTSKTARPQSANIGFSRLIALLSPLA